VKRAAFIIGKASTSEEEEIVVLNWNEEVIFIVFSKESKKRIASFDKLSE
jgi:hypothetical protein